MGFGDGRGGPLTRVAEARGGICRHREPAETPGGELPFERRLLREMAEAGCTPGDVGVCVGDSAEWLRPPECGHATHATPLRWVPLL